MARDETPVLVFIKRTDVVQMILYCCSKSVCIRHMPFLFLFVVDGLVHLLKKEMAENQTPNLTHDVESSKPVELASPIDNNLREIIRTSGRSDYLKQFLIF